MIRNKPVWRLTVCDGISRWHEYASADSEREARFVCRASLVSRGFEAFIILHAQIDRRAA